MEKNNKRIYYVFAVLVSFILVSVIVFSIVIYEMNEKFNEDYNNLLEKKQNTYI